MELITPAEIELLILNELEELPDDARSSNISKQTADRVMSIATLMAGRIINKLHSSDDGSF